MIAACVTIDDGNRSEAKHFALFVPQHTNHSRSLFHISDDLRIKWAARNETSVNRDLDLVEESIRVKTNVLIAAYYTLRWNKQKISSCRSLLTHSFHRRLIILVVK